ncbi:TonB-dependent siderophore receptor [Pollutimonas bauzanensis]|uniref:Iron complex outermembrane recepter protein n=1 Tax=Pollutimonas bauzanensis TaxID=658167 RepID=A0A1M5Y9X3_9BURK|nr:TonB-dependent receptor [Pollutimonas bauzanensis]SHI08313.1 iron complex outermembrane recepter protein [Pollutimonas bauzanensis]
MYHAIPPFLGRPTAALVSSVFATAYAAPVTVDLPAQALSESILQLARLSGRGIAVDSALVEGRQAPAVKGAMEPLTALNKLLAGSGLEAATAADGNTVITKAADVLKEVRVVGHAPKEGTADVGYKIETAQSVGPWGRRRLLDTPYSMMVVSEDLIQNSVTDSTDQLFRMNPRIQLLQPFDMNGLTRVMMRGFLIQSAMVDGMQGNTSGQGLFIENVERMEAMTGLSGFMYGIGNVGGTLNYMTKRPTESAKRDVTVGNYGGDQYFAHADLGGPIDADGKFAYRFNALTQDGDTVIKDQSLKRSMVSGALDWHVTDRLLLGIDVLDGSYKLKGRPGQWGFANSLTALPSVPDTKRLWASPDNMNNVDTERYGARVQWDINDIFAFRAGYGFQKDERNTIYSTLTVTGDATYSLAKSFVRSYRTDTESAYAYLETKFKLFDIANKLTVGANGYVVEGYGGYTAGGTLPAQIGNAHTNLDLSNPDSANVALPDFDFGSLHMLKTDRTRSKNIIVGNETIFNDKWSMLLGLNHASYLVENHDAPTGAVTIKYDKSKTTPTASLLFKPLPYLTTYVTYIEALQQGQIVSGASFTNDGEIMPPSVSKQYEAGVKAELGGSLLTMSLFQIEKANAYNQDNGNGTFTMFQNGRQRHQGVEFAASGKATHDLTLLGGLTLLDAEVQKSTNNVGVGKVPQGVAQVIAKVYGEYNFPSLRELTATGGLYYTGKSYIDAANKLEAPSYLTIDLGLRYSTRVMGRQTTIRALVTNLTDKRYWMSNYTIGTMMGAPRAVSVSASIAF